MRYILAVGPNEVVQPVSLLAIAYGSFTERMVKVGVVMVGAKVAVPMLEHVPPSALYCACETVEAANARQSRQASK